MKSLSRVRLFATPWTVAYQAPLSMGFSRQWYWSGLPFPSPADLPNPGIERGLPHCRQTLYCLSHQGSQKNIYFCFIDYVKVFDCVDHNKLWKILQEMGIPDHLTCLLRNLYAGQEVAARTEHGTTDWFQIGKGVCQGCILSPCLFNFHAEYIM